ncbi:MAG: metallophosphoesterase [Gammaproteobacteria bacterium]|nr:metallophosphoesterase [Gammaproteobacteria bacterium]
MKYQHSLRGTLSALALSSTALLAACSGGSNTANETRSSAPTEDPARVRFIAVGDSGSGYPEQFAVGEAIGRICAIKGCDFAIGLGDNIYEDGTNDVLDEQFDGKFEQPYAVRIRELTGETLPFYMVLGNHDNTGYFGGDGARNATGDTQVDYHYRDVEFPDQPRATDSWKMPARYYSFTAGEQNGEPLIAFYGIDSSQIAGGFADSDPRFSYSNYGQAQLAWLQDRIERIPSRWKFVFAHHPYMSGGSHGNAGNYDGIPEFALPVLSGGRYKDFLEESMCDKVDMLFAGHDHHLEWINNVEDCGKTQFIVSGAGGKTRGLSNRDDNPVRYQVGDSYGFWWVEVTNGEMVAEAYVVDPGDNSNFGVLDSAGNPAPSFGENNRLAYQAPVGLDNGSPFSGVPIIGGFIGNGGSGSNFDPNDQEGLLDPVEDGLVTGLTTLGSFSPDPISGDVINALAQTLDLVLEAPDSIVSSLANAATEQDPAALAAGAQRAAAALAALPNVFAELAGGEGGDLPPPFDQLSAVFEQFGDATGGFTGDSGDLSLLVTPLVQLARNLENIADAGDQLAQPVPVINGVTGLLAGALLNTSNVLVAAGTADTSNIGDQVTATVRTLLDDLATGVIPIEQFAPPEITEAAQLPGAFISSGLHTVNTEILTHLDQLVAEPVLGALLGALEGLLGFLRPN